MTIDGKKTATGLVLIALAWVANKTGVTVNDPDAFAERVINAVTVLFEFGGYALTAFGAWHKQKKIKDLEAKKLSG